MLRDRIIIGVQDKKLQLKLLDGRDDPLTKIVETCKVFEAAFENKLILDHKVNLIDVKLAEKQPNEGKKEIAAIARRQCYNCGKPFNQNHRRSCPAVNAKCFACGNPGHFSNCCRRKSEKADNSAKLPTKLEQQDEQKSVFTVNWSDAVNVSWSEGETRLMLALYREYFAEVGPLKKFKTKKALWQEMRRQMNLRLGSNFSENQIENKFKTISRRHKRLVDNNRKSGASRMNSKFADEFREIAAMDDSLKPESTMDTTSIQMKDSPKQSRKTSPDPGTNPGQSKIAVQRAMLEAYEENQRAKEKRHRERMERIDAITTVLNKIADKL
ncbi:uncharacterized protein LOC129719898 [Wyeomyia smithii]|uniref:uncharacterized protein LOC129719898 n=1 Tax=Wyeomyia smithii TaxID=174621 RepID=UPI002467B541|nr:uncharacterized protein LOC129719898 [Wyeomyia smithii]